jgi:RND family efflux transporter MFP subunit
MPKKKIIKRALLSLLILAAGFFIMQFMASLKKAPPKQPSANPGRLVEVMRLSPEDRPVVVSATGTVQARKKASIVPQVSGKVVSISPAFIAGGFFNKGDRLFEIESVDYELLAEKSRAAVAKAEFELSQVESQARVARLEWDRIRIEKKDRPNPLVLYEPQLKNARAALASAKADLKQRRLDIERTRIRAPFNGRIRSESIDSGQFVAAGQIVGEINGTDTAEIVVPVALQDLRWLTVPRHQAARREGSQATISITVDDQKYEWQGRIDRSLGEVDPKGRMIRLVIGIDDPYDLKPSSKTSHNYYLADGLFVDVRIDGHTLPQVFLIPASALRENATLWLMDSGNRLIIRKVEVIRRESEHVITRGDIAPGDRLVLTYLAGAVPGTRLRPAEEE